MTWSASCGEPTGRTSRPPVCVQGDAAVRVTRDATWQCPNKTKIGEPGRRSWHKSIGTSVTDAPQLIRSNLLPLVSSQSKRRPSPHTILREPAFLIAHAIGTRSIDRIDASTSPCMCSLPTTVPLNLCTSTARQAVMNPVPEPMSSTAGGGGGDGWESFSPLEAINRVRDSSNKPIVIAWM